MKVVIIIPTYNERENIHPLLEALHARFIGMQHDMNVLVVDDDSPDGTADEVRAAQKHLPGIHLVEGRKAGLGAAYIRGMRHAMERMEADVVFEMDADFSHKPEDVPRLMAEIDKGADFVIGSRYVRGGSIPDNWGLMRRMNSRYGNFVARYVAGISRVRDCTAGFRAIRTSLLRDIDLSRLRVQGYAFQVSLLNAAVTSKARIVEVPVDFIDRAHGESKLGLSDIVEFIVNAWWIRLHSSRLFIKFALVGLSGVAVNLGVFSLLCALGVNRFLASPLAIEISIVSNFLLNNSWTFRLRRTHDKVHIKGLKFNMVSLVALGISYSTFVLLTLLYPRLPPWIPQVAGIAPAMLVNYFLNSYWTFRQVPQEQAAGVNPRASVVPKRLVLSLLALWSLLMLWLCWATGVHHDYANYLEQWNLLIAGADPWSTDNAYGPIHTLLGYALHFGTRGPKMLLASMLVLANAAIVVTGLREREADANMLPLLLCIPCNIMVIGMGILYGLNDALVAFLLTAAILFRHRRKFVVSGLFIGLAGLTKFYPLLLLPFFAKDGNRLDHRLPTSGAATFFSGMAAAYLIWGRSVLQPLAFGSARGSKLLSIFAALDSVLGQSHFMSVLIRLNTFLVLFCVLAALLLCFRYRLNWLESAAFGYLSMLMAYKVGHPQFYLPFLFVVSALWLLGKDSSDRFARAFIPLALFLSLYQAGYLIDHYGYGTRLEWVRMYGGFVAFPLILATLHAALSPRWRQRQDGVERREAVDTV